MEEFGLQIAEIRKRRKLSQADLANAAGVSQATISRLEAAKQPPSDIRLLSKVAKALEEPLADLLPLNFLREALQIGADDTFFAFCPNPFCDENRHGLNQDGECFVRWTSSAKHDSQHFDEINYCASCGTELVKECPSCNRRFAAQRTQFCITCGTRVCGRPTEGDWKRLREMYLDGKPEGSAERAKTGSASGRGTDPDWLTEGDPPEPDNIPF